MSEQDRRALARIPFHDLLRWLDVFSSCAIEDNKQAGHCSDILHRHMGGEAITDKEVEELMSFIQRGFQ